MPLITIPLGLVEFAVNGDGEHLKIDIIVQNVAEAFQEWQLELEQLRTKESHLQGRVLEARRFLDQFRDLDLPHKEAPDDGSKNT